MNIVSRDDRARDLSPLAARIRAATLLLAALFAAFALPRDAAEAALPALAFSGLIVNRENLRAVSMGFQATFQEGLGQAKPQWNEIAMEVPSTTEEEKYGWLGAIPGVREWVGDRHVHGLSQHDYAIKNKNHELTVGVNRNHIEDDKLGIYKPMFGELGRSVAAYPDQLSFGLLKLGFSMPCYDGQYFFDTDHPVLDPNGAPISVANTDGGSGTPWFLIDTTRMLKPIVYQLRRQFAFVSKDRLEDDNVFDKNEFVYGTDGRCNVGFGLWQLAWGSKQTLNAANYAVARAGLMGMKRDYGRPIGVTPNKLVVPPSLESAGRKILNSEYATGGETNEWKGTAELLVVPWLA